MSDKVKQFGRSCQLIVGKDGTGISISKLRISFDIMKTSGKEPNTAKIEVYNLSPEKQNQIIEEWQDVQLMAGYEGFERMIFQGQIRSAIPRVDSVDRILTIECGDGDRQVFRGFVNKTLEKGCTASDVISECKSAMFDIGTAHADELKATYSRGKVLSGRASDIMTEQCNANDAQWSIQDGEMIILQSGNVIPNAVWLINDSTGMLGSPEPTTAGVKVKSLLNPAYLIGGLAKIESAVFSGGIRIETMTHRGDTHGDDWVSELDGLSV